VDPEAPSYKPKPRGTSDPLKKGGKWDEEFIWNTNWQGYMDFEADKVRQRQEALEAMESGEFNSNSNPDGTPKPGALGLSRLNSLNDVNVDLSEELQAAAAAAAERSRRRRVVAGEETTTTTTTTTVEESLSSSSSSSEPSVDNFVIPRDANGRPLKPTPMLRTGDTFAAKPASQSDSRRWSRSTKFTKSSVRPVLANSEEAQAEREAEQEEDRIRYEKLKTELQSWTLGLTVAVGGACAAFYSRDVTASYLVGALGGVFYLRLLNRTVDAVGGDSLGGAAGGSARLLIPAVLVLGFNRFNEFKAEELGMHLELLPGLAGFFTYKMAVIGRQSVALANEMLGRGDGEGDRADTDKSGDGDATSVDRAFTNKILRG